MNDWHALNPAVIEEFRANGGQVSRFGGLPVIILHTIGARSGVLREIPLIPVFDGDDMYVYGTAAGSPTHPGWVHNLRGQARITVEYGTERFTADVVELPEADAQSMLQAHAKEQPQLAQYLASAAPRRVPVFSVNPT